MLSGSRKNRWELLFSLLAIAIIIAGYVMINGSDNLLHSAAVAKIEKTYSAEPTGKAYSAPANTTAAANASPSSAIASYQQNGSAPSAQLQEQPLYAGNFTENQTAVESSTESASAPSEEHTTTETAASPMGILVLEKPKEQPKLSTSASTELPLQLTVNIEITANKTSQIILDITNPTSAAIIIQPVVQEITLILPNEERIRTLLAEELLAEQPEKKAEFPQKIQESLERLQLLEKEKVKPIYIRKAYHLFQPLTSVAVTALTYSGKRASADLLKMPVLESFIVPALEQKKVILEIPALLSASGREVQFLVLAEGKEQYVTNLKIQPSFGADFDIDYETRKIDLYFSVPAAAVAENKKHQYMLEMQIRGEEGVIYYELFGPYTVAGKESALFSQEFQYDQTMIYGKTMISLVAFKDGREVMRIKQEANFGEGKI